MSKESLESTKFFEKCMFLNSTPVLVVWHFQHHIEILFKEILLTPLISIGKVTYYAIRIGFQVWGLHHIHSFIWILNLLKLNKEAMERVY